LPKTFIARVARYERKGFPPQVVITSMIDPVEFPASEIVALYHERWELELGYDELKAEMLEREESIRCKSSQAWSKNSGASSWRTTWFVSRWNARPTGWGSNPFTSASSAPCA
jgi:hypothetical protein